MVAAAGLNLRVTNLGGFHVWIIRIGGFSWNIDQLLDIFYSQHIVGIPSGFLNALNSGNPAVQQTSIYKM